MRFVRNAERGGSLIELLISIPLLLILVGGMVASGRLLYFYSSAAQTTFNSALYAAGLSANTVTTHDVQILGTKLFTNGTNTGSIIGGVNDADFSVNFSDSNGDQQSDLVSVRYEASIGGLFFGLFNSASFAASATLPILGLSQTNVSPEFANATSLYCGNGSRAVGSSCTPPNNGGGGGGCHYDTDLHRAVEMIDDYRLADDDFCGAESFLTVPDMEGRLVP